MAEGLCVVGAVLDGLLGTHGGADGPEVYGVRAVVGHHGIAYGVGEGGEGGEGSEEGGEVHCSEM